MMRCCHFCATNLPPNALGLSINGATQAERWCSRNCLAASLVLDLHLTDETCTKIESLLHMKPGQLVEAARGRGNP